MRQNYGGLPRNPPLLTNTVAALTLAATRLISSRHSLPDTTPQHQQPCPTPHLSVSAASPPTSKPKPPTVPSSSTSSLATNGSFSSPTLKTTLLYVTLDQSHGPCLAIFYLKSRTSHRAKVSKQQLTPWSLLQVCTTELGAFAKLEPEFTKRGVKLIGLSANTIDSHGGWIKDINEISQTSLKFPIIGDKQRQVALKYDMYVLIFTLKTRSLAVLGG